MNAPASFNAPPPALVVISGGPQAASSVLPRQAHDAAFQRLLKCLPPAQRVLELGCGSGELAQAYKRQHPGSHWTGVDSALACLTQAQAHVDSALCLDLATTTIQAIQSHYDLIVVNRLERLPQAATVLSELGSLLAPGGVLFVLAENHARLSSLAHLIEADVSTGTSAHADDASSLDRAHPRFQSPSTIYKMLMDAAWMPTLIDNQPDEAIDDRLAAAARYMGEALGVPPGCPDRVHRMKHLIIRAQRPFDTPVATSNNALFDVVVPTTKEQQLRVNVEQSPGLNEVQAHVISYRHATSPAQALSESLQHVRSDWVLLCHQDIYFPKGFGHRLNEVLSAIPAQARASTLLGFVGMGVNRQTEQTEQAGFVVDRLNLADHPDSDAAVSIDELALVVARDSVHKIDPLIGWHLWATDLCLTSVCTHRVFPRIVRLPIFHNSQSGWQLPESFNASAEYLLQKHSGFDTIHTLCGVIDQGFVARHRSAKA